MSTQTGPTELAAHEVKARAVRSVLALTVRTFASQGLRIVSTFFLARLLFPADYGVFGIVAFFTSLGAFLGDLGLSAALVRQPQEPSRDETYTVFWCHQAFTAVLVLLIMGASPFIVGGYELGASGVPMVCAMAASLFLSSLRVIPMMMLERKLLFPAIARAELAEGLVQTAVTLTLAALHMGPWALVAGTLARGLAGLVFIWAASPWRPSGTFQRGVLKRLLSFGAFYQLNGLIPAIFSGWVPLVVGQLLGKEAVGLVGWSWALASTPLMLSSILHRVAFPAYSRMQQDAAGLAEYLRVTTRRISAVLCLGVPFAVIAVPPLIPLFFGERWAPAAPLVQWYTLECTLQAVNGLLASQQNASGHSLERLYVTTVSSILRALLGTLAVLHLGIVGIGMMGVAMTLTELWLTSWMVARRNAHLTGLEAQVMEPFVTVGALLALSLGLSRLVQAQGEGVQALVATGVLAVGVLVRERLPRGLPLLGELRAVIAHVRARRAAR